MIIYISGKITGTADYMERFAQAEKRLKVLGHKTINPAKKNKGNDGKEWAWYMRRCIKWLCGADAIYMLRGWRKSPGARLEHQIAVALGMSVFMEEQGI